MRTTIEIKDDLRAKLLELAARRGLKGFSSIVEEALERYLEEPSPHDARVEAALAVLGTVDDVNADAMEDAVRHLRSQWR